MIVCQERLILLKIVGFGPVISVMMIFRTTVMEQQENLRTIANAHVVTVSVRIMRIVRLTYYIVYKDIAMRASRIRIASMEELAQMVNASALKNLKEYIVKNVMSLKAFVNQLSKIPSYIYELTVM